MKIILLIVFIPLGWGVLSDAIFSVLQPRIYSISLGATPKWIWLWILQMVLVIPVWRMILTLRLHKQQRWNLIKPNWYLWFSYFAVVPAIWLYDTWYAKWFVFGGVVSPVFEEMFTRHLLTPWLKDHFLKFSLLAVVSSISFSLMHWGFNSAEVFNMSLGQQWSKFLMHFTFIITQI